jgi:MYXO-CTERM domain-containing protein
MVSRIALFALIAPFALLGWASHDASQGSSGGAAPVVAHARPVAAAVSAHEPVTFGDALADEARAHVALALRFTDEAAVDQLLADQQNPASPRYHAWLTPQEFGARFGLPEATYARIVNWLTASGFAVTRYPNRLFVEGRGTAAGVRRLLGVQPRWASARGQTFRSYAEALAIPDDIAPHVARIGGIDTRRHLRRRMNLTPFQESATQALGAVDMRALYDMPTEGNGAAGLTLVVLGTEEGTQANENANPVQPFIPPSTAAIQEYLTSIAGATVAYKPYPMDPTTDDLDSAGSNGEYQLDVEMQSVGAPNAKEIDLVLAPSSEVFMTGAQYIVNSIPQAIAVSTSLGSCEPEEIEDDAGAATPGSEAYVFAAAIKQGLAEGQTWFAAAGDSGADDCNDDVSGKSNGFGGGNATADFPCSMPEMVCMGGTQFSAAGAWNASGYLTAWQTEDVWNEGQAGGAGGGGQSIMYPKPTWQTGVGPKASDGTRDVPDLALTAATAAPGVAVYDCGSGQDTISCTTNTDGAGQMDIFGGTSVASPLAAGLFAHLAGQLGCRLGDVHPVLYALGAQQDGGAEAFHDITSGNNNYADPKKTTIVGFAAGPGYDLASGWGSFDLTKLIAAWPPCTAGDGGVPPTGDDGGVPGGGDDGSDGGTSPALPGDDSGTPGGGGGNGATGSGSASAGCSCTTAGEGSSQTPVVGLLVGLGLVASRLRRRRRGARLTPPARSN